MTLLDHIDQAAVVTFGLALVGLLYDSGRKAQQLSELRDWRRNLDPKIDSLMTMVASIHAILERRRTD